MPYLPTAREFWNPLLVFEAGFAVGASHCVTYPAALWTVYQ